MKLNKAFHAGLVLALISPLFLTGCPGKKEEPQAEQMVPSTPPPAAPEGATGAPVDPNATPPPANPAGTEGGTTK